MRLPESFVTILRRAFAYTAYIVRAKWDWSLPKRSRVLVYDAAGSQFLGPYLARWNPEILHRGGERINLRVLLNCLLLLRVGGFRAYVDQYIREVGPELVVTYIDNSKEFYTIWERHPSITTMFVQNALRGYYGDVFEAIDATPARERRFKVDYMLTVGRHIGDEYARFVSGQVIPIGTLRNNAVPTGGPLIPGTIGFVSQFRDTAGYWMRGKFYTFEEFWERADRPILAFLRDYCQQRGKRLIILTCSGRLTNGTLEKEKAYYRSLVGDDCEFSEYSGPESTYQLTDQMEVVVSIDSTIGYESAIRGNKTAIFAVRGELISLPGFNFGWPGKYPEAGPFWTSKPDSDEYARILSRLFAMDQDEWRGLVDQSGLREIIAFDPGNRVIQDLFNRLLGEV